MMASDRSGRGLGAGSKGTAGSDDDVQIGDRGVALVGPDTGPDQGSVTVTLSAPSQAVGGDVSLTVEVTTVTPEDAPQDAGVGLMAQADTSILHLDQFRADPRFLGINGAGLSVAVLDTGINLSHPFFGNRIVYSYDFSGSNDPNASDTNGHGSNVASIIGSQDGTYTGMAPGVNIIALKVFPDGANPSATSTDIAEALNWVVANRAAYNIVSVNMSLGSGDNLNFPSSSTYFSQFANLAANNTAVVVASGNSYSPFIYQTQGVSSPSADPNAWSIGAVWDRNAGNNFNWATGATDFTTGPDRIISFSQRSTTMTTVFAPGGQIAGAAATGNGTVTYSGTSQAAPHVAGLVADMQQLALWATGHFLSVSQLKQDMIAGSVTIFDGDDENDNVANTFASYHRVDAWGWANQIVNDVYAGTTGNDTLHGTSVADAIHGNLGNDTIWGNDGNDSLFGDAGDDTLFGGAGNDYLDGGTGNDTLTGGPGSDTFHFAPGCAADTITDFSHAEGDKIDLTAFLNVGSLGDVVARASLLGTTDTFINFGGGDTLTLRNITPGALAASDFFFTTTLEAFGSTRLVQVANNYAFYPVGGSSGPQIRFNGAAVTAGQFGAWVPFAAEAIGGGYEVAWKIAGTDQYSVWNTDGNGNMTTNPTGIVSGTSFALENLEYSFQQDLNGDSFTGVVATTLESFGATKLSQFGNTYVMSPTGGGSGVQIKFNGAVVTAGLFGAWAPIGAEAISGGYEVAWKMGTDQYSVWNTDGNGNMTTNPTGIVSGSSFALKNLEGSFQQDLNGDTVIGYPATTTTLESFGATKLTQFSNTYSMSPVAGGSGVQIKFNGAVVTAGQFGEWAPIGAEAIGGGYEVAWKMGTDQYSVWNTDGNGNMTTNPTGVVSGSSFALENLEGSFQQDLNGDSTPGLVATTLELFGATKLSQFGNTYVMSPVSGGAGLQIKFGGAVVTAGQFGAWNPIGAEAISGGYEIAWKQTGTSQYSIWLTDSNGNMTTNPTGVVAGSSSVLRAYEPSFHQDLNGDTVIGSMSPDTAGGSATLTMVTMGGSTHLVAGKLGTVSLVGTGTLGGSSGLAITDLSNGAGGSMNLAVMGDYMASSFVAPAGQSGGTILSAGPSQPDDLAKPAA
jgi:Ca2+-binding RTX toxin-like protein/20S proteasome alpha/beta subunit